MGQQQQRNGQKGNVQILNVSYCSGDIYNFLFVRE